VSATPTASSLDCQYAHLASTLAAEPCAIVNAQGIVVWRNSAFLALSKDPQQEVCNADIRELLKKYGHGVDELELLSQAIEGAQDADYLVALSSAQLAAEWYRVKVSVCEIPAKGEAGFMVGMTCISDEVNARDTLENTKKNNSMLFESVKAGMGDWDLVRQVVNFGPLLSRLLGDGPQDWLNRPATDWLERCHPNESAAFVAQIKEMLNGGQDRLQTELRVRHARGYWLSFIARGQLVRRTPEGNPANVTVVLIDVTELRYQDTRWRHRAKLSSNWFWSTDEQGKLSEISHEVEQFLGTSVTPLIGKTLPEALKMGGGKGFDEINMDFVERRTQLRGALVRVDRYNAAPVWVELDATPRFDVRGEFVGFEGVGRDVTERRNQELQLLEAKQVAERSNRAKSAFLASMSHEIRTPMNGVLGMAEMLSTTDLDDDQAESLGIIRRSATHLLTLIDGILDFSKLDANRVEVEERTVQLADLLYDVAESLVPVAQARHVSLRAFCAPSLPPMVLDETRMRQVMLNLVGNAIKFSGTEGRPAGKVYVRADISDDEYIKISVTDNGIGIAPSHISSLFEAFNQAEVSTTRRFGGTGLGLAISKKLVELMGGRVEVASVPDEGSVFSVYMPLKVAGPVASRSEALKDQHLVVVGVEKSEDADLLDSLQHVGAKVYLVPDIAAAFAHVNRSLDRPMVCFHNAAGLAEANVVSALSKFSWPDDVNHLLITDGARKSLRMVNESTACVDWGRPSALVNAAALMTRDRSQLPKNSATKRAVASQAIKQMQRLSPTIRVLVAEDDPINRKVIAKQLAHIGVAGDFANNGCEALQMLTDNSPYSLLLTDLHMPEMDGYELTRRVRAQEVAPMRTPILALTANAIQSETFEAYKAGIDLYLTKPILLQDLYAAISTFAIDHGESSSTDQLMPHFDRDVLMAVLGDDPQTLREVVGEYQTQLVLALEQLTQAMSSADLKACKGLAHRLKSSSRSVGALQLGELFAQIEALPEAPSKMSTEVILSELKRAGKGFSIESAAVFDVAAGAQ
jgi:PAS domain S-box-containing protein